MQNKNIYVSGEKLQTTIENALIWDNLKNKPFDVEYKTTTIMPEMILTGFVQGETYFKGTLSELVIDRGTSTFYTDPLFEIGNTYIITWDGEEYECIAYNLADLANAPTTTLTIVLGNVRGFIPSGSNIEPFVILYAPQENIFCFGEYRSTETSHSIKIEKKEIIKTIDEYYEPLTHFDYNTLENQPIKEEIVLKPIIENFTLNALANTPQILQDCRLEVDSEYRIILNNKEVFDCASYQGPMIYCQFIFIGNNYYFSEEFFQYSQGRGEPFCLYSDGLDSLNRINIIFERPAIYNISIYKKEKKIKQLDLQYLPKNNNLSSQQNILQYNNNTWNIEPLVFDQIYLRDQISGIKYNLCMLNNSISVGVACESIEIVSLPINMSYHIGDILNPAGLSIKVIYSDNTSRIISMPFIEFDITSRIGKPLIEDLKNQDDGLISSMWYGVALTVDYTGQFEIIYRENGQQFTTNFTVSLLENELIDFEYTENENNTYTITDWKETFNGQPSTECIIPNSEQYIL